ncbi:baseplate J/gp47 family protein [Anoxybacillus sp. CHMUD]|uniref:baseplate J/gp47 family protein n=1 Tax=Anoxybacillus sp. CHMUD TaxID=2508870 RepID=UPI002811434E|nr:baseplate J/gp47 family protein [Anoxybacillus sp. CHMUD]
MLFENQTFETILGRMLNRVPNDIDKREGSIIYDALAPAAIELAQVYMELNTILRLTFSKTSSGEYLDRIATNFGVYRKKATSAVRKGIFTDLNGVPFDVPIGSRFRLNDNDMVYVAIEKIREGQYRMQAETAGSLGNQGFGKLLPIEPIEELGTAVLSDILIPGEDEEDDDALRQRYFERISMPSSSGNDADYIRWAKEVPGIGYVRVFRRWNGPGTVRIVVITDKKKSPSPQTITKVKENIESKRPLLADVTVDGAKEISIDIDVKVTLNGQSDVETALQQIKNSINDYLLNVAFFEQTIRYAKIGEAILNAGYVLDYENLRINGGTGNIQINGDEIAVLGRVTLL